MGGWGLVRPVPPRGLSTEWPLNEVQAVYHSLSGGRDGAYNQEFRVLCPNLYF